MQTHDSEEGAERRPGPAVLLLALLAALLLGAAGTAGEVLLLAGLDLGLGAGRGAALGLVVWLASWSLGAFAAGRSRRAPRSSVLLGGLLGALALPLAQRLTLSGHGLLGLLGVALTAAPQGWLLPLLVRRVPGRGRFALLWAADLLGGVSGVLLVAGRVAAEHGRPAAGTLAALLVALASALVLCVGPASPETPSHTERAGDAARPRPAPRRLALVVGLGTGWMAMVQTAGLRLGALDLSGMLPALEAVLAASLASLALGALLLPPLLPRDRRGVGWVLLIAGLGSLWFASSAVHQGVHDLRARPLLAGLLLVGPPLLPFGALVPCLHRAVAGEGGRRLGDLLLHEAWGALLVTPFLAQWVLPRAGLHGALAAGALAGALAALGLAQGAGSGSGVRGWVLPGLLLGCATALWFAGPPARRTPVLANPAFRWHAFREDGHYSVSVVDDGVLGERTLLTDGFRATATGEDYLYMRALGHVPVLLHSDPRRVAVLAFGTGTTAGAVSLHPEVRELLVLELSANVIDCAPYFAEVNRDVLRDPRTRVVLGDGRRALTRLSGELDVLTMEPLLPDAPAAVHLYTPEFYALALEALAPGGVLCQWVPPHALRPGTFEAVVGAFTSSLPWSGVLQFGSQLLLVGGREAPLLDPGRFPAADASEELADALERLGLERPGGLLGRWVCAGSDWPQVRRPLTDADPWVVHARPPRGPEALGWLPDNLELLVRLQGEAPLSWRLQVDEEDHARVGLLRDVRELRRQVEVDRARSMGWAAAAPEPGPELLRRSLEARGGEEAELVHLGRRMDLDRWRTEGVRALAGGDSPLALDLLSRAAELRPERGDLHLFVALALAREGLDDLAGRAAARAFEACPRILETPQGRVAEALDPVQVSRLRGLARK